MPRVRPGEKDPEEFGKRYRLTHVMETLAQPCGDVEALVAVKARDLSNADTYLKIAEVYREAKQPDTVLDWAERGVEAFPERTDSRQREFLADEYHRRKRHAEAMQLVWKIFAEHVSLENFQTLKKHADRIRRWPARREKALTFVRDDIEREKKTLAQKRPAWGGTPHTPDHSMLVQLFLWEKDIESTWRVAQIGGCHDSWWMKLAKLREKDFPAEVMPVYQKRVGVCYPKGNAVEQNSAEALRWFRQAATSNHRPSCGPERTAENPDHRRRSEIRYGRSR